MYSINRTHTLLETPQSNLRSFPEGPKGPDNQVLSFRVWGFWVFLGNNNIVV